MPNAGDDASDSVLSRRRERFSIVGVSRAPNSGDVEVVDSLEPRCGRDKAPGTETSEELLSELSVP